MAGPVGLSPTDIVQGIALATRICESHFVKARRADGRYVQFGIEIGSLKNVLEHLEGRLSTAAQKYEEQRLLRTTLCDPRDQVLEAERRNLVGDFRATLRECEVILSQHSSYLRSPSNFRQNVLWEFSVQAKVDRLLDRIKFHISKISLVMEQLQDGLLRNMAATLLRIEERVTDIHNVVVTQTLQPTSAQLAAVPAGLAVRFHSALMIPSRPQTFTRLEDAPIQEGFDALAYHFFRSTVLSHGRPGTTQPLEQYINLMKSLWLLDVLKRTTQFEQSFYYRRATLRMQQLVGDEVMRPDLTPYSEADFDLVNTAAYAIWIADDAEQDAIVDDGLRLEEQILELPLRDIPGALTVFRMSDTELRLVQPTVITDSGLPSRDREVEINVHSYRFEPVYASPWSVESACQVKISSSQVRSARVYEFKDIADVYQFQRAITNFKVVHDQENVQWSLDKKKRNGKARLQLWQYKPLTSTNESGPSPAWLRKASTQTDSAFSAFTNQTSAESITQGLNSAVVSIIQNPEAGKENGNEVVILEKIPLPALVLFTVIENQRTFLHLDLDYGIRINIDSCQCRYKPERCLQVVIENRPPNRSSFKISTLAESLGDSTQQTWDLSVFGLPRHPLFGERVKSLKVTYLALTFATISEKDNFVQAFNTLSLIRLRNERDYLEAHDRLKRRANRPNTTALPEVGRTVARWKSKSTESVATHEVRKPHGLHSPSSSVLSELHGTHVQEIEGKEKDGETRSQTDAAEVDGGELRVEQMQKRVGRLFHEDTSELEANDSRVNAGQYKANTTSPEGVLAQISNNSAERIDTTYELLAPPWPANVDASLAEACDRPIAASISIPAACPGSNTIDGPSTIVVSPEKDLSKESDASSYASTGVDNTNKSAVSSDNPSEKLLVEVVESVGLPDDVQDRTSPFVLAAKRIGDVMEYIQTLTRRGPLIGHERITWDCACGKSMYADIREWKQGAALKLQKHLRDSAAMARTRSNEGSPPTRQTQASLSGSGHPTTGPVSGKSTSHSQQTYSESPTAAAVVSGEMTSVFTQSRSVDHSFLLLCINTSRGRVLEQIAITALNIENDEQLFNRIREEYRGIRGREAWHQQTGFLWTLSSKLRELLHIPIPLDLTIPKALEFVKFRLVPVKACCQPWHFVSPAFPPEPEVTVKRTYHYRPCPQDEFEITSLDDILLHSLLEPGPHLDHYWLDLFPKKLRETLIYKSGSPDANTGWGIRIVEGLNWVALFWLALFITAFSGVLAIVYSILTRDPGGGFTMAGYFVTLLSVGVACLQVKPILLAGVASPQG